MAKIQTNSGCEEASEFREWLKKVKQCCERVVYQLTDLNKAMQLASANLQNILDGLDRERHNQEGKNDEE